MTPPASPSVDFGMVFASLPDCYLVLDTSFRIVAVSDAYAAATLREPAELVGQEIFEAFPDNPGDPATTGTRNLRASLDRVRRTGQPDLMPVQKYDIPLPASEGGGFEERFWSPSNSPVVDHEGRVRYLVHRVEDITHILRAQGVDAAADPGLVARAEEVAAASRSLKEANGELALQAAIVQTMAEAVALVRASDGTIVYVNPRWNSLFGYEPGELEGQSVAVVNAPTDRTPEETAAEIIGALERDGYWTGEVANVRKDGTVLWCAANVSTLDHPEHGTVWVSLHTDITARKRMEDELVRSNAELGEFAYVASHDLTEPLRTVAGFAQLLGQRHGEQLDQRGRDYLRSIGEGVDRMQRLLDDLLSYARAGGELEPARVNLAEVVDEAREVLGALVEETGATIEVSEMPAVRGDRVRLVQLLQNLIANALRFRGDEVPRIAISCSPDGGLWRIRVTDNGVGIAPEQATRIFDMFHRGAGGDGGGTGIGLAICKRIVELHGGTIAVTSRPGAGATFTFTLPAAD